jgi:hypothetical protein
MSLVGLLDEDPKELPLDLETGLRDTRLDLVGEMLVLIGHGHSHLQLELERQCLPLAVDGFEWDGSLEVVGVTYGESPPCNSGGSSGVFSSIGSRRRPADPCGP